MERRVPSVTLLVTISSYTLKSLANATRAESWSSLQGKDNSFSTDATHSPPPAPAISVQRIIPSPPQASFAMLAIHIQRTISLLPPHRTHHVQFDGVGACNHGESREGGMVATVFEPWLHPSIRRTISLSHHTSTSFPQAIP